MLLSPCTDKFPTSCNIECVLLVFSRVSVVTPAQSVLLDLLVHLVLLVPLVQLANRETEERM